MLAGLTDFKQYMGLVDVPDQDTLMNIILTGADAWIRTYCGREFESMRRSRRVDAVDCSHCWVPEFPLTIVHGLTAFTNILDTVGIPVAIEFVAWWEKGQIYTEQAMFVSSVPNSVFVDYTAGYSVDSTAMRTLNWICLEVAAQMYRNRGIFNLSDYNAGGVQYQKYTSEIWPLLGPEVMALLASFRTLGPRDDL